MRVKEHTKSPVTELLVWVGTPVGVGLGFGAVPIIQQMIDAQLKNCIHLLRRRALPQNNLKNYVDGAAFVDFLI